MESNTHSVKNVHRTYIGRKMKAVKAEKKQEQITAHKMVMKLISYIYSAVDMYKF